MVFYPEQIKTTEKEHLEEEAVAEMHGFFLY